MDSKTLLINRRRTLKGMAAFGAAALTALTMLPGPLDKVVVGFLLLGAARALSPGP